MNSLCEHPELRASPHLYVFLKNPEGDSFEKAKKDFEKVINPNAVIAGGPINKKMFLMKNPIKVDHIMNIKGEVECKINGPLKELHAALDITMKDFIPGYAKCKHTSILLGTALTEASSMADKLAEDIAILQKTTSTFNAAVGNDSPYAWNSLENIYGSLVDAMKGYGMQEFTSHGAKPRIRNNS